MCEIDAQTEKIREIPLQENTPSVSSVPLGCSGILDTHRVALAVLRGARSCFL